MSVATRLRAWQELGLGPRWVPRQTVEPAEAVESAQAGVVAAVVADVIPDAVADDRPGTVQGLRADAVPIVTAEASSVMSWDSARAAVAGCRRCGLCDTRQSTVFGSGPEHARWLLIGEAPGAEEDRSGQPFVGQAGRLLDRMLAAIGLDREQDVFITNVLKCRPPGNRNPEPDEVRHCADYLSAQIRLLRPERILLLGRFAAQSVLSTDATISSLRGKIHHIDVDGRRIPVICTYHPAYLLRNLPDKRKSWEDLCLAASAPAAADHVVGAS